MRVRTIMVAVAVLVGGDWLACRLLARRAHATFDQWQQVMADQGWSIHTGAVVEDGMPFGARLTVHDLSLSGGRAMVPGGLDLRSERLVLTLGLTSPYRLVVEPQGDQHVRLAGLPPVVFAADTLSASVKLWRGTGDSIDIVAEQLAGGLLRSHQHQDVRVDHVHIHLTAARGFSARTTARVTLDATGVGLPDDGRWPLGATIGAVAADFSLASPALSGVAPSDQARAWRDWGGAVTLDRLDLHWGPLTMATAAHLGLDDRLQPAGSGTAHVAGWAATLDALARGGALAPGVAQTAKVVLGLMAMRGDTALSLPFTLHDSTLSVGKVPLMHLDALPWGGA